MKPLSLLFALALGMVSAPGMAQRMQQQPGRGVVAVQNGSNAFVSWRRLAQEPENTCYNIYIDGVKKNTSPLTCTNYTLPAASLSTGSKVTIGVIKENEETISAPFTTQSFDCRNMFMSISFDNSPLEAAQFNTAYVWPADLDGDGEMDYVVNRKNNSNGLDCYVEAYLRTGEHLWTVKLGPNELSCAGQDDMILAYDLNCDGKSEVMVQTSDGTQFWDPATKAFGLYVGGNASGDTDNDGIIDYETQTVKNAPRYMSVIDGMKGTELCSVEQTYNSAYNRTNRSLLMGDEYNKHVGHVGVFYPDGIHPAVVMEWHVRYSNGAHDYYNSAFGFDFSSGKAGAWKELFCKSACGPAFHQIRIADLNGDGKDEMQAGGYAMAGNGETLYSAHIAHGDRFRTTDIDPERPGLETFAIQQNASDMLGQILYDAATGTPIKKWYMPAVGDVGRGECMDFDPQHLGWEMWSTMGGIYDATGELIPQYTAPYPSEAIWWDGAPDREMVQTSDSHHNVYIQDFFNGRLIEIAKLSGYRYVTVYAKRAAFWGDIIGDWREELILLHKENGVCVGIAGFTTDIASSDETIYYLQEDPAYRMQCTTKGYYQSPCPGFYLGYDMPRPPLPPVMVTDLVCRSTGLYTAFDRNTPATYTDGKSVLLDLNTDESINIDQTMAPGNVYAMIVNGQSVTLNGSGCLGGENELWKSGQGSLTLNIPVNTTGTTYISEGTLVVNNEITGRTALRARGNLAGSGTINELVMEGALHHEGGRLIPQGALTLKKGLNIDHRLNLQINVLNRDVVKVEGDVNLNAALVCDFTAATAEAGRYMIMEWTGTMNGDTPNATITGLGGLSRELEWTDKALYLVVNEQRAPADNVEWTGAEHNQWDYTSGNFMLQDAPTTFVAGDKVVMNDAAQNTLITMDELFPMGAVTIDNDEKIYSINGEGGWSGNMSVTKKGSGTLNLNTTHSDYTGATIIEGGKVKVKLLADGGLPSSLGAAGESASLLRIGRATLCIDNSNTSTNRGITLTDSATLDIPSGTTALKGMVSGNGTLIKTGAGQLNLTYAGTNPFQGIVLKEGTLAMGTWNTTLGATGSKITVLDGVIRIFDNNSTSAIPQFNHTLDIPQGGKATLAGGSRCRINGKFTGEGTLNISFPYVRGDFNSDMSDFAGVMNVSGNQLRLIASTSLKQAHVNLLDKVYVVHTKAGSGSEVNLSTSIGTLAGTSADACLGTGIWNIGARNEDAEYRGTFTTGATVNKVGTGEWTLSHAALNGNINVNQGMLTLDKEAACPQGTLTVNNQGTLILKGRANQVVVNNGGTLRLSNISILWGVSQPINSLNVNKGGHLVLRKYRTDNDRLQVKGNVMLNAPTIEFVGHTDAFSAGDELQILEGFTTLSLSGDVKLIPETPGDGLAWDLSTFKEDGVVRVKATTHIHALQGVKVKTPPTAHNGYTIEFSAALPHDMNYEIVHASGMSLLKGTIEKGTTSLRLPLQHRHERWLLLKLEDGTLLKIL